MGNFQATMQRGTDVVGDLYTSRNEFELKAYLDNLALNPDSEVLTVDASGNATPLSKPTFSAKAINARLDALNLVAVYANRLADLAGSDAPAQFNDASVLLGQNLTSLDSSFRALSSSGDPTANAYIGPVSALVGQIGQMILEQKRDRMITQAIDKGTEPVKTILTQVQSDLQNVFSPLLVTANKQKLAGLVGQYNTTRKTISYEQRQNLLQQIDVVVGNTENSELVQPANLIAAMLDANDALVRFAKSSRKPADFAAFNSQLNLLTTRIESFADQVKLLLH